MLVKNSGVIMIRSLNRNQSEKEKENEL